MENMNIQNKIVTNIHWVLIIWIAYGLFGEHTLHVDRLEAIMQEEPVIESKIVAIRKDIRMIGKFKKDLNKSKTRVIEVGKQVEMIQKQLPSQISDGELLDLFTTEAELLNILDVQITPRREKDNGPYITKGYQFTGVGTYLQFLIFFERIASVDRIINITEFSLKKAGISQRGRYTMLVTNANLEVFKYNPKGVKKNF